MLIEVVSLHFYLFHSLYRSHFRPYFICLTYIRIKYVLFTSHYRMFKIMILLCMSVGPCFSAVGFEPGLTARERQYVSECAAARYDIALLSAKVPEKPMVAGKPSLWWVWRGHSSKWR